MRVLVEEKGADGFSISEAARRAGVSSAAPYKHFSDRAEIVREVALAGIDRMRDRMDQVAQAASGDPLAPVTALGLCYADFARTEPGVFRLIFGLAEGHERDAEMQARGDGCLAIVKREIRTAMPEDTPETEIERRSLMLHMFVHGHAFLEIDGKHELELTAEQEKALMADISRRILRD
ncbi:TetR/AcrR family transcriptional regulator [Tateyamaria sp. ANG-S1]|uniref:TetR/AcrR family transcriptional regulator n=1 Tax=Tateyamaria sp. ANG-S1 TaxID=1577905 RepID=UPI00187BD7B0|nr:TetR/AcrR family transcriptional regulator [Tateyamaria sp. ANG-S1]